MPAQAEDGWLTQAVERLAAVPHTLAAVQGNEWLQISVTQQRNFAVSDEEYRRERPRLDALAAAAHPELERELDAILSGLTFTELQQTAQRHPLDYCSWIGTVRPDGMAPSSSDLQALLMSHCRSVARRVIVHLLDQHIEELHLTLPALPGIDLNFPRWILGDLASLDGAGQPVIDALASQATHQDRLKRRIATALPTLQHQLDEMYAARRWSDSPLIAPDADCRALLGRLSAGDLLDHCIAAADRWLASVQPAVIAAIPNAMVQKQADGLILSEDELCKEILGRWLPGGRYPGPFHAAVSSACAIEADRAVTQAISKHAARLAADVLALPRNFESLLTHAWFGQPGTLWDSLVPTPGLAGALVRERLKDAYAAEIAPAGKSSTEDAVRRIEGAYKLATGSVAAIPATRTLCGADGRGYGLPVAGQGGEGFREKVAAACREASSVFEATRIHTEAAVAEAARVSSSASLAARVATAMDRAGLKSDDQTLLLVDVDGVDAQFLLRELVVEAARAGLEVRVSSGFLGSHKSLRITPMGADAPVLSGSLVREDRGLRLSAMDSLPGWPAEPAETVVCLTATEDDLANAQFGAVLTVFGGMFTADVDRPRLGGKLLRNGFKQLQQANGLRACVPAWQPGKPS